MRAQERELVELVVGPQHGGAAAQGLEGAADGVGVLALGLGDEGGDRDARLGLERGDAQAPLFVDVGLLALEPGGDGLEELARDLGQELHVAQEHRLDAQAPARRVGLDVAPQLLAELGAVAEDLVELAAAEDARGRMRDQVVQGAVPVADGEDGLGRVDDAELEPQVDEHRRAAGVVDVNAAEVPKVALQRHAPRAHPGQGARGQRVQAGAPELARQLAERGDQHRLFVVDLDREEPPERGEQRQGERAGEGPERERQRLGARHGASLRKSARASASASPLRRAT